MPGAVIVVPTVPHTGTHFMRDHLLADHETYVRHVYPSDMPGLYERVRAGHPCIVPLRDFDAVTESWTHHGKNPKGFAGMSLIQWWSQLHRFIGYCDAYTLNIDEPALRDDQLYRINAGLGLDLETDWPVIRQPGA